MMAHLEKPKPVSWSVLQSLPPGVQQATLFLNAAFAKEEKSDLPGAIEDYQEALSLLIGILKAETNAAKKQTLRAVIDEYMSRAEALKQILPRSAPKLSRPHSRDSAPTAPRSLKLPRTSSGPSRPTVASIAHARAAASKLAKQAERKAAPASSTQRDLAISQALSSLDPKLVAQIENEIVHSESAGISFDDVVGLEDVKQALHEMVILPSLRPDLFSGLRKPASGLLLYGPPGNGKTFIARAVAAEAKCTFFSISAAAILSKNFGEGERIVRTLFAVARARSPSIIFVDEIDSMLKSRSAGDEHEASRRIKTEFMVQMDGITGGSSEQKEEPRVLLIAATNTPDQLDDAIIRRLPHRVYIPPPNTAMRLDIITKLLHKVKHSLSSRQMQELATLTECYSASDLTALCRDAAMGPIREVGSRALHLPADKLPPVSMDHFKQSLKNIKPSISKQRLQQYAVFAARKD